jgi:outer membrane PBP1 activator LpoA protein
MAGTFEPDSVIPSAPGAKNGSLANADQLDKAGKTILSLLHKAAGVAEANSQQALELAQKLSHQLHMAENRIAELEAEVGIYQDKADRAEEWLHKAIWRSSINFCVRTTAVVDRRKAIRTCARRVELLLRGRVGPPMPRGPSALVHGPPMDGKSPRPLFRPRFW